MPELLAKLIAGGVGGLLCASVFWLLAGMRGGVIATLFVLGFAFVRGEWAIFFGTVLFGLVIVAIITVAKR